MIDFFKQKEEKPFSYPSIEMRKPSRGYFKWIAVVVLFIIFLVFLLSK
jgi:uncharacterized integral membrane protein